MTTLVKLVSEYYIWLIGACALGILFYIGRAIMAHREKNRAIFTLEKEAASSTRIRSIGMVFVLLISATVFYSTATYLEPNLDFEIESEPTPTVLLQPTPTPTMGPSTSTPTPRPTRTRRPTQTPEVVVTLTPTPKPVVLANCPNPQVRLTYPTVNAILKGSVEIRGSAYYEETNKFDYYKFEFRHQVETEWSFIQDFKEPVVDGILGNWSIPPALPAGEYTFRLVVVDKTGNYLEPCEVNVTIEH